MSKVPSADDFLDNYQEEYCEGAVYGFSGYPRGEVTKAMIDFARLHVEAMRKAIMENAKTRYDQHGREIVDSISIYEAYPLENIT